MRVAIHRLSIELDIGTAVNKQNKCGTQRIHMGVRKQRHTVVVLSKYRDNE